MLLSYIQLNLNISWNNLSNGMFKINSLTICIYVSVVIYIDQPIGTGFSFGKDTVNSTEAAAPLVWKAFQILFESGQFSKFQSREYAFFGNMSLLDSNLNSRFIFATESYGGHYGPSFVTYFDEQNAKIKRGTLTGEQIVVSALMINKFSCFSGIQTSNPKIKSFTAVGTTL